MFIIAAEAKTHKKLTGKKAAAQENGKQTTGIWG